MKIPALVDVNCRIDSKGDETFLFDWHQDYWFSVCSPSSVVAWVPMMDVDDAVGGLEVISNQWTDGKIYATSRGTTYKSYADAVKLAEAIPVDKATRANMQAGDMLFFKFNVLHKSAPIASDTRSRFTVQFRFADFADPEFRRNAFKPGVVNSQRVDFLSIDKKT